MNKITLSYNVHATDINFGNFDLNVQFYNAKIKKDVDDIQELSRYFETYYSRLKSTNADDQREIKKQAQELIKIIYAKFSSIEITLREYEKQAKENHVKLKKERVPDFEDYIEMTSEEYLEFKEREVNDKRLYVWVELFVKKLEFFENLLKNDIVKHREITKKLGLISAFYRQIRVVSQVIQKDSYMIGSPDNKILIKEKKRGRPSAKEINPRARKKRKKRRMVHG